MRESVLHHSDGYFNYENKSFLEIEPSGESVLTKLRKSAQGYKFRSFGILKWAPNYNLSSFIADASAACVVTVMLVPQGMAYSILAGLDPIYGLYTGMVPLIVYSLFTSTSQMSPGPVAPSGILMEGMVRQLSGADPFTPEFTDAHFALAAITGIIQLCFAAARVGWVASLLSHSVMTGFASAAACLIIASQLGDFFGLSNLPKESSFFLKLFRICQNILDINWMSFIFGLLALIVMLKWQSFSIRGSKLPKKTPMPLVILLLSTLISYILDAENRYQVHVIGSIPTGLPKFSVPKVDFLNIMQYVPFALVLSTVNYAQTVSLALLFGKKAGEDVSPTAEMLALGATSFVGSFFQSFLIAGSFTRTAIQVEAGPKTPAVITLTGLIMVLSIFILPKVLTFLPFSVLAGVVINCAWRLVKIKEAKELWNVKKTDFLQVLVTFIGILLFDIMYGLVIGIGFSLMLLLYRTFSPRITEIGKLPGTDVFVCVSRFADAKRIPHVKILRLDGAVHFGNIGLIMSKLDEILHDAVENYTMNIAQGYVPSNAIELCDAKVDTEIEGEAVSDPMEVRGSTPPTSTTSLPIGSVPQMGSAYDRHSSQSTNLDPEREAGEVHLTANQQSQSTDCGDPEPNAIPPSSSVLRSRVLYAHSLALKVEEPIVGHSTAIGGSNSTFQNIRKDFEITNAQHSMPVIASSTGLTTSGSQKLDSEAVTNSLLDTFDLQVQDTQLIPAILHPKQSEILPLETRVELGHTQSDLLRAVIIDGSRIADIDGTACKDILATVQSFSNVIIKIPVPNASDSSDSEPLDAQSRRSSLKNTKKKQEFRTYRVTIRLIFSGLPGPVRDTMDRFIAEHGNVPPISNYLSIPAALTSIKSFLS